ncbi:hypothetical protein GCM10010193_33640 [Kitasatospora atroaurantiaca]
MDDVQGQRALGGLVALLGEPVEYVRRNDRAELGCWCHVAQGEALMTACHDAVRLKEWNRGGVHCVRPVTWVTLDNIMRYGLLLLSCRGEGL